MLAPRLAALSQVAATNRDMSRWRTAYPHVVGTRLDSCLVCHPAGSWRLNRYGEDYAAAGASFTAIESLDSDGDGVNNVDEIMALTFPGDPSDFPTPWATTTITPTAAISPTVIATAPPTATASLAPTGHPTMPPTATATVRASLTAAPSMPGRALLPAVHRLEP